VPLRRLDTLLAGAALAALVLAACSDPRPATPVAAIPSPVESLPEPETASAIPVRIDTPPRSLRPAADTVRPARPVEGAARPDTARRDSTRPDSAAPPRKRYFAATDTVPWPDLGAPAPGALLPSHRIIAFYGNPLSKRMGILGELPPAQMLAKLEATAAEWAEADSTRAVRPALHMIVTVAQAGAGADGKYRLRMTDSVMERVARWAEERGWLFFVDVQPGLSSVEAELPRLVPLLRRPYVHLALDPEFAMRNGARPGRRIGTMDAAEINHAIDLLSSIVKAEGIPPKVLVIHRFTSKMLTNASKIRRDPNVQVVIDMDGFGAPSLKRSTWRIVVQKDPVQYTGFKLFYKNDKPMMTMQQVIDLYPSPVYVQYQ
jgi:hypothetical protein